MYFERERNSESAFLYENGELEFVSCLNLLPEKEY